MQPALFEVPAAFHRMGVKITLRLFSKRSKPFGLHGKGDGIEQFLKRLPRIDIPHVQRIDDAQRNPVAVLKGGQLLQ